MKTNIILLPSSYFDSSRVDDDFINEFDPEMNAGLWNVIYFDYDKWINSGKLTLSRESDEQIRAEEDVMSFFLTRNEKEIIVSRKCGCKQSFRIAITDELKDDDFYGFMSFLKETYDTEYDNSPWRTFMNKVKKIWDILTGNDYCYSDVLMSKEEFKQFKEYINNFEV